MIRLANFVITIIYTPFDLIVYYILDSLLMHLEISTIDKYIFL